MSEVETRKGVLRGGIYPLGLQGSEVEIEVVDEYWGRCHAHSLWVRLDDLHEPEPQPPAGGYVPGGPTSFTVQTGSLDPELVAAMIGQELRR